MQETHSKPLSNQSKGEEMAKAMNAVGYGYGSRTTNMVIGYKDDQPDKDDI